MSSLETHYSAPGIEGRILTALRAAGLNPEERLSPETLGALDQFHTGGLGASRDLARVAGIGSGDYVLDIGAGLAGAARMLAGEHGCRVACIEMSADYCDGARLLNRITGLEDRIEMHQCSALQLPFADGAFDVAWMQNVGMNIADKRGLYAEIARVLKRGGRFAFQEMIAGNGEPCYFPLPWASHPEDNCLVPAGEMQDLLAACGLKLEVFEDAGAAHVSRNPNSAAPAPAGQLGLAVFVDNLGEKAANARRSLEEGRVRLVRGVFRRT